MSPAAFGAAALIAGLAALILLRRAWRAPGGQRPWLMSVGWVLLALALLAAASSLGAARGPFAASALISVLALVLITAGIKLRDPRKRPPRELALEPSDRPSKAWRGGLRGVLAGPLGGIAAMGVGLAYVTWVPGAPQTRMVIGGMMVPVLWAGGMAWTLSDDKILRATAVLTGVTLVTFAAAALKGFS